MLNYIRKKNIGFYNKYDKIWIWEKTEIWKIK